MTFTYDPTLATSTDKVRFRIGDTDATVTPQLSDEEINATVAAQASFSEAMARCAEALAAKYFRHATSKQAASLKVTYEDRVKNLLDLASRIRSGAEAIAATDLVITGTTKTELMVDASDSDVVQPAFRRGQFDNPGAEMSSLEQEEVA
jgi:hypothetical protein